MDFKDFVEFMAKQLVDEPEGVNVKVLEGDSTTVVELCVSQSDIGKVIGRQGRTAKAMRTLLSAVGSKHKKRCVLEIIED